MILSIDKFTFEIKEKKSSEKIQKREYYNDIPASFLKTYTTLSDEEIKEIKKNQLLMDTIINNVYANLNISDENKFIKTVNETTELFQTIDGVLIRYLKNAFNYSIPDLIKMTSRELLITFLIEIKGQNEAKNIDFRALKEAFSFFYSEETVNSFLVNFCEYTEEKEKEAIEEEIRELENL